jgi:hypothetical protein
MKTFVFLDYFNLLFAIYSLLDEADFSHLMRQNSRSRVKVEAYNRMPMRAFPFVLAHEVRWFMRRRMSEKPEESMGMLQFLCKFATRYHFSHL